jgi:hypothetical protein
MRLLRTAALLALLSAPPLPADVVHLKNGGKVDGTIVAEDDSSVTLRKPSGAEMKFKKDDIDRIERGAGSEGPREDPDAPIRAERIAPTGNAALDALRGEAGKALSALAEKKKALATAAKKIDSQTNAYELQLGKVTKAEQELKKVRTRRVAAEAKAKAAEAALKDAVAKTGREPATLKADYEKAKSSVETIEKTEKAAQTGLEIEQKKLNETADRFQLAAETLRPAVGAVREAQEALDASWAALAAEERRQRIQAPWWPGPADAARVRIEGRVERCEKGRLVLRAGADADPAKWAEEVTLAGEVEAKAGEIVVVSARRGKDGWVAEEVSR